MDYIDNVLLQVSQVLDTDDYTGEDFCPNKFVENDPRRPREFMFFDCTTSEEYIKSNREHEREVLRKRADNFSHGVNIYENLERIDIDLIHLPYNNWNFFPLPNKGQLLSLMSSIENIGMLQPIILLKENETNYTILEGRSRYLANVCLNAKDPADKYKYPLCCILDTKKMDEFYIRAFMIDLNLSYRALPQHILVKMLFERHEILRRSKKFRNESNIAEQLSMEFMMSTSSVYNYLALKKLSDEVMTLVLKKRMNLQIARLFAKLDHKTQVMVLENIDFKEINCLHKMKFILEEDLISPGIKTENEIKRRVDHAKDMVPQDVRFTVKLNKELIMKFSDQMVELLKYAAQKFSTAVARRGGMGKYCKVKFDKEQMKYLVKGNYIDEKTLDKFSAKNISDVFRK